MYRKMLEQQGVPVIFKYAFALPADLVVYLFQTYA
jgi:hypothetical protein